MVSVSPCGLRVAVGGSLHIHINSDRWQPRGEATACKACGVQAVLEMCDGHTEIASGRGIVMTP